jgi:MtrB/PioB family decaheme-associated outer membrane protein
MRTKKHPMRYALLAAAIMQAFPGAASAADAGAAPECEDCPATSGRSAWVEGAVGAQSDDSYHFGRYTGYQDNGLFLNAGGEYRSRGEDDARYVEVDAIDLGLDSRELTLRAGRQGSYGFALEYDELPNYRVSDTRSPYISSGDGQLDLPAGWLPGDTTGNMPTLANDLVATPLETQRERLGARFSLIPARDWELSGHFRREQKDGTRDVGATIGSTFNQTVILPVPIDYQTDDFGLAVGYKGQRLQARLAYAGSLFNNDAERIKWENPFAPSASSEGQMAESPDNEFHQISAQLGYQLGEATRLGASFARGRMTQDEAFLPYDVDSDIASLPVNSLDGEVDTTLAKVEINSRPTSKLRLDASYTYSDRDNNTAINTFDPVVADVAQGSSRENRPYSFEQNLMRAKAGYRVSRNTDLALGVDYDQMKRTYQQVEETEDLNFWGRFRMRPFDMLEATLKASHASRDASPYTPLPGENSLMRVHYLSDRDRNAAGVELSVTPAEKWSVGLNVEYFEDEYSEMFLGLQEASGSNTNIDVTYVFSEDLSATAYYNYDRLESQQAGSEWTINPASGVPWLASDSNLTKTLGLGVKWAAIPEKLDLGFDLVYADYTGKIQYAGATDLPTLGSTLTGLGLDAVYRLKDDLSIRAGYRYERYEESDWAKLGEVDAIGSLLSLGEAPVDSQVHWLSLSLRYEIR